EAFVRLGLLAPLAADAIEQWARGERGPCEYVVAEQLRLPRYRWFSWRYVEEDPSEDRIEVDADGRVRTHEEAAHAEVEELLRTLPPTRKPSGPRAPPERGKKPAAKKTAPSKSAVRTRARSARRS